MRVVTVAAAAVKVTIHPLLTIKEESSITATVWRTILVFIIINTRLSCPEAGWVCTMIFPLAVPPASLPSAFLHHFEKTLLYYFLIFYIPRNIFLIFTFFFIFFTLFYRSNCTNISKEKKRNYLLRFLFKFGQISMLSHADHMFDKCNITPPTTTYFLSLWNGKLRGRTWLFVCDLRSEEVRIPRSLRLQVNHIPDDPLSNTNPYESLSLFFFWKRVRVVGHWWIDEGRKFRQGFFSFSDRKRFWFICVWIGIILFEKKRSGGPFELIRPLLCRIFHQQRINKTLVEIIGPNELAGARWEPAKSFKF